MDVIKLVLDVALNLDHYLGEVIKHYGALTYAILFVIVFIETGLVIVPFLPGDSLLFAAGAFAALGHLDPYLLFAVLTAATLLGDTVNFSIGRRVGKRAARSRWIKPEHLARTHAFFERHGRKTIFLARFVPDRAHGSAVRGRPERDTVRVLPDLQPVRRRRLGGHLRLPRLLLRQPAGGARPLRAGSRGGAHRLRSAGSVRVVEGETAQAEKR